jgi:hypothetical protein
VLGVAEGFGEVIVEIAAVIGLPHQIAREDPAAIRVPLGPRGRDGAGRDTAFLSEGPKQSSAADLASGGLDARQIELLGLRPVVGDVVQILGISTDLLKQCSLRFDVGQVLLTLIFFLALLLQAVGAPDALQGAVTEREIEFAIPTAGPESGKLLAQRDDLLFDLT